MVRQVAETRGLVGGFAQPNVDVALRTADGVPLVASLLPGPSADAPAVVLAHGFAAHRRKPAYAALADELSAAFHVLTLDLRGHGRSGGRSALGGTEHLDLEAARAWLADQGHACVAAVGVSMGATSVAHALSQGLAFDAVVLVSGPAWLHQPPRTAPMQRLDALWRSPVARWGLDRLLGVALVPPETWPRPPDPVEAVRGVGTPVLVVHGVDDPYFPLADAEALAAAAGGRLWAEPEGFGHAEDGIDAEGRFARRLAAALSTALAEGAFAVDR